MSPTVSFAWLTGASASSGHEHILRIAVDETNKKIGSNFYEKITYFDEGLTATSKLILGNHATDFPTTEGGKAIAKFYNFQGSTSDWHHKKELQNLHFLRSWDDCNPQLPIDVIEKSFLAIDQATSAAIEAYKSGDSDLFQYLVGHVTHIIQDGFSPAHVRRNKEDPSKVDDICVYSDEFDEVCVHEDLDVRDS
ncbi:MAG: hypothetical protein KDD40_01885, partial [Bdellovibrionales bacterium]|nr:hypothetical protein [Bdellovibrionales bacterium]